MDNYKVTVGIPAFNSETHIDTCIDSILNQTMSQDDIEIIIVNDGSTDGTGKIISRYAALHPNIAVVHQENTGGPGEPRNTIIEAANGDFIFFVDADDFLGKEALERMYKMGAENRTDIILGKFVGVNGRGVAKSMFRKNVRRTNVFESSIFEAIGPTKMFRTSFLREHGILFPKGVLTAEDQPFVVKAYVLADGISVVADYPCYYVVNHQDKEHASVTPVRPAEYYASLRHSIAIIEKFVTGREKQDLLIAKYLKKELLTGRSVLFPRSSMRLSEKRAWLAELNRFLRECSNERVEKLLPLEMRISLSWIKKRDLDKLALHLRPRVPHA